MFATLLSRVALRSKAASPVMRRLTSALPIRLWRSRLRSRLRSICLMRNCERTAMETGRVMILERLKGCSGSAQAIYSNDLADIPF